MVYSGIELLSGLVLGGCKCPGIYPFLLDLLVCVKVFIVFSDGSLYFCGIGDNIPFVISFHLFYSSLLLNLVGGLFC